MKNNKNFNPNVTSNPMISPFIQQPNNISNSNDILGPTVKNANSQLREVLDTWKNTPKDVIYNTQVDRIEDLYSQGKLDDKQYAEALNRIKNRFEGGPSKVTDTVDGVQERIDRLNKEAVSNPNLTVKEYMDRMNAININESNGGGIVSSGVDLNDMRTESDFVPPNSINFKDDNIEYKEVNRNGINYNIDRGRVRNIDTLDDERNIVTSNIVYDKDFNPIELNNPEGSFPIPGVINDDIKALRSEELAGMSSADWEAAEKNLEQYGFGENANVLDERIKVTSNKKNAIDEHIKELKKNKSTPKSVIEELEEQKKKLNIQEEGLSYRQKLRSGNKVEARANYKASQKDIVDEFKNKTSNLSKESREYVNAQKEMKSAIQKLGEESEYGSYIRSNKNNTIARVENLNAKPLRPMKVLNAAFAVKQGVDKYKESRAEGKGVVSSAVRGAGSVAVGEALGPVGYTIYSAAKTLPKAVIKGTNALYSETRKMNSASNFTPLGGVSFQDTQQLATMRQSGMELAKMSQYNLEQTLMGAEAKHLHR